MKKDRINLILGAGIIALIIYIAFSSSTDLEKGKTLLEEGEHQQAIELFNNAIVEEPGNAEAYYYRGLAYYQTLKHYEAAVDFRRAINLDNKLVDAYVGIGASLTEIGELEEAKEYLDMGVKLDAKNPHLLNNRGNTLMKLLYFEDAIKDFEASIAIEPDNPKPYSNRIISYEELANCEQVFQLTQEYLNRFPPVREVLKRRASCYEKEGDLVSADEDLRTAASLNN